VSLQIYDVGFSCSQSVSFTLGSSEPMSTFTPRHVLIGLAVLFIFLVPYTLGWAWGWWKFAGASIGVVLLWRWARPEGFVADLGIRVRRIDFAWALSLLLVVGIGASCLIPRILRQHGYIRGHNDLAWMLLAMPFQTLNEEMVLRALLLTALAHILKVRFFLSIAVAGVFALLHVVLYRFAPPHATLSVQALTTLLFAGFALNELFLATGSIAGPWAIHFGWNLTRFGNDWIGQSSPGRIPQGADFNWVEGNPWVIALAVALAVVSSVARPRLFARPVGPNAKAVL
jgi:membrane protease YdiL (CAAX protease family)